MRARFLLLLGLITVSPSLAFAQMKLPSKTAVSYTHLTLPTIYSV